MTMLKPGDEEQKPRKADAEEETKNLKFINIFENTFPMADDEEEDEEDDFPFLKNKTSVEEEQKVEKEAPKITFSLSFSSLTGGSPKNNSKATTSITNNNNSEHNLMKRKHNDIHVIGNSTSKQIKG